MNGSPSFSDLLAQPGPSAPGPLDTEAAGGVVLNNQAKQAAMTAPLQQARIRARQSFEAVKRLGFQLTQGGSQNVL